METGIIHSNFIINVYFNYFQDIPGLVIMGLKVII